MWVGLRYVLDVKLMGLGRNEKEGGMKDDFQFLVFTTECTKIFYYFLLQNALKVFTTECTKFGWKTLSFTMDL